MTLTRGLLLYFRHAGIKAGMHEQIAVKGSLDCTVPCCSGYSSAPSPCTRMAYATADIRAGVERSAPVPCGAVLRVSAGAVSRRTEQLAGGAVWCRVSYCAGRWTPTAWGGGMGQSARSREREETCRYVHVAYELFSKFPTSTALYRTFRTIEAKRPRDCSQRAARFDLHATLCAE